MIQAILRAYSYIAHIVLSLFLLGVGIVALLSEDTTLQTDFLPWSGDELRNWLILGGVAGLIATILAFRGKLRVLFLLWTVVVGYFVTRGIFASSYQFEGESEFKWALGFWAAVLATVLGAISRVRQPIGRR